MAKKRSIREFVSEESLKFQLYLLKYSNQLKDLDELTVNEIEDKWEYNNNKKINKWIKNLNKPKFEDPIAQKALKANIKYLGKLSSPISEEMIMANFNKIRKVYIKELNKRIKNNSTATKEDDIKLLEYAKIVNPEPNISKEKFGIMLLLIVKNLSSMPSFSGYSSNWKTDFYSNAIEKTLLYLNNFDTNLLSVRTGEKSKAFAYVTQISYNAFVNIIIERKKGEETLKNTISLESANIDGVKTKFIREEPIQYVEENVIYTLKAKDLKDINTKIKKGISHIIASNKILEDNSDRISEIDRLESETPSEDKNADYKDYINDLKSGVIKELDNKKIDSLEIIKPKKISLEDWVKPEDSELLGIKIIISNPKEKKAPKVEEVEEVVEEVNYFEEW